MSESMQSTQDEPERCLGSERLVVTDAVLSMRPSCSGRGALWPRAVGRDFHGGLDLEELIQL